jgi:isocitrate/isopropylmalate dehydrogenase
MLSSQQDAPKPHHAPHHNRILVIKGQGIGPECVAATQLVLAATGVEIDYLEGSLGYPDARDLFPLLKSRAPEVYAQYFGVEEPILLAKRLEEDAKKAALKGGNINDFYKKLLAALPVEVLATIKTLVTELEKETLQEAQHASAVLKGALRTLDEGSEPSRNVTIRKAFEQYANIRRCVTLDPIAPGAAGADILFVRENVEDLYASIEHRLARNYPQALRHQTPEGCELICRAAFEAGLREGRKKVTALEKPNILKITGGLFKETFLRVAKDYAPERLGERGLEAQFMIIDDGLAAIAATPERFDVVVTSNMFGDIGSDIAAKVTGGVGLVSSNNINPLNPRAVSMFETMGGTADDIAGQDKANPVALMDAAAEMLLHIGGKANILAAELIKTAILEVLADGYSVGDIQNGPYQEAMGREKVGTQAFARLMAEKIRELKELKERHPERTIKEIALMRVNASLKPLFERVLRSYDRYVEDMSASSAHWLDYARRNVPPNPIRARSRIVGFDLFVDDGGLQLRFDVQGQGDLVHASLDADVLRAFGLKTGIDLKALFDLSQAGSLQAVRSFGQYAARMLRGYLEAHPQSGAATLLEGLEQAELQAVMAVRFSPALLEASLEQAVSQLEHFDAHSLALIQAFYLTRAAVMKPILAQHSFKLVRITSRGTEIYPTMCDFEKRDVDRYRIEIDPAGPLADAGYDYAHVQGQIAAVQAVLAAQGWMLSEMMLNRSFTDLEGAKAGQEIAGVSVPYGKDLGANYADAAA